MRERSSASPPGRRRSSRRSPNPSPRRRRNRSRSRDRRRRSASPVRRRSRWSPDDWRPRRPLSRSRSPAAERTTLPPPPPYPPPPPRGGGNRHHAEPEAPPPAVGSILRGTVASVRPFGVFVSLPGHRRDALAHHTAVAPAAQGFTLGRDDDDDTRVRALSYFAPPGAPVYAKVVSVGPGPDGALRVGVSLAAVDQETGAELELGGGVGGPGGPGRTGRAPPRTPLGPPPEVGRVHPAIVAAIQPFGVFVTLEETGYRALVPAPHVAEHLELPDRGAPDAEKAAALAAVVAVGDRCFVKIFDVSDPPPLEAEDSGRGGGRPRPPRVSASIRAADQRTGSDLDPGGLTWRARGGGGGAPGADGGPVGGGGVLRPAIGSNAATTTAPGTGVVSWGHLAADNYGGTGQSYDLVVADADTLAAEAAAAGPPNRPPEAKEKKKTRSPRREITSVEEALAILDKYGDRYGRSKKQKKRGSGRDKKRTKKKSRRSCSPSSSSTTTSSSSSSGSEG